MLFNKLIWLLSTVLILGSISLSKDVLAQGYCPYDKQFDIDSDGVMDMVPFYCNNPAPTPYQSSYPSYSSAPVSTPQVSYSYDDLMKIGDLATQERQYILAYRAFEAALYLRPGNTYATKALENVTEYIQRQREQ